MERRQFAIDRMAAVFNEWNRRYADDPGSFEDCLDNEGQSVEDYGKAAALFFSKIADEMDANGLLPRFGQSAESDGMKTQTSEVE